MRLNLLRELFVRRSLSKQKRKRIRELRRQSQILKSLGVAPEHVEWKRNG